MQRQSSQHSKSSGLRGLLLGALLLAIIFIVWANRQYIADTISYWQFQPNGAIERMTDRTQLSDSGRFMFYASQPVLATGKTFNDVCDKHEETTAILGCYTGNRIYIYDVTDTRLDGIEEVTAAHEMLHAVYQRLSRSERDKVDKLIEAEYDKLKDEPGYAERMSYYARTEPGQRNNELHSIIGTEIATVSSTLEDHYRRYFNNRSAVVNLHKSYRSTFITLEQKQEQLAKQLESLSSEIERQSASYSTNTRELSNDIDEFNQRSKSGYFTSLAQFNQERRALIDRSDSLSEDLRQINSKITEYNRIRDQYNQAVTQSNDLYKSLDSSLTPAPKV